MYGVWAEIDADKCEKFV